MLRGFGRLLPAGLALAALAMPAHAFGDDPYCLSPSYGNEPARPAPLRFGIDPELAGSVGTGQSAAVSLDESRDIAALHAVTPRGKQRVLRVTRLLVGRRGGDPALPGHRGAPRRS